MADGISRLWATCPFLRASSNFLEVGFSVRSIPLSWAIASPLRSHEPEKRHQAGPKMIEQFLQVGLQIRQAEDDE